MSYQQQNQGGYGQYNPYGEQGNPYQSGGGYGNTEPYNSRPEPQQQSSSRYGDEESAAGPGSYQMTNMNGGNSQDRILNDVRNIDRAIDDLENSLQRLSNLHNRSLSDSNASDESRINRDIEAASSDIMAKYRGLVQRIRVIKSDRESGNPRNVAQVGKVDRRMKTMINQYQQVDRDYRKKLQEQIARQYRIVRPDASDAEVRDAVENPRTQVFSDALINSDRRGQANQAAQNVSKRHEQIQQLERAMVELAQLFQDLEALVVQQEPAVMNIEQKGEEVNDHVQSANVELDGAVKKAKAARRKKFWCLGIAILIVLIIVAVVVVAVVLTRK